MSIIICSGHFNPLHQGHLKYLEATVEYGQSQSDDYLELLVIVNNDEQVKLKNGIPFLDEDERYEIVSSLWMVNTVFIARDIDKSVAKTLEWIVTRYNPHDPDVYFINSGDRHKANPKEDEVCQKHNIHQVFLDLPKINSSSEILDSVGKIWVHRNASYATLILKGIT